MTISELIQASPKTAIVIIGIIVSFISMLATKYLSDQKKIKELKDKQKEHQKLAKEHKHDTKKVMEINKEMMKGTGELMKHSMKPALITFIPFIILFGFLRKEFSETILGGGWIWWYLIVVIISSTIFRKILKVN